MTRRRWIADEVSGNHAALIGAHAEHLTRVLRARVGQEFDIITNGVLRRGRIASISERLVEFDLGEEIAASVSANLTLLLSIFKFDRMEWAIEKCTELGAAKIIPVIAKRTDTRLASASAKRSERWRRLALQASEQSRRTLPLEFADPIKLGDAVNLAAKLRIVLAETEDQATVQELLDPADGETETLLAIGPEGGWTEDELQLFQAKGWKSASLGPTILRAETAAIAATVLAISALSR